MNNKILNEAIQEMTLIGQDAKNELIEILSMKENFDDNNYSKIENETIGSNLSVNLWDKFHWDNAIYLCARHGPCHCVLVNIEKSVNWHFTTSKIVPINGEKKLSDFGIRENYFAHIKRCKKEVLI